MRGVRLFAFAALLALAAPAAAKAGDEGAEHETAAAAHEGGGEHAAEHEAPSINGKTFALQLVNFGVLLFLLIKFGGPAVRKALEARHQQIKSDLASAAEARAAAQALFEQQEKRLAALENEIAAIVAGIKQEAEAEKERLIALAEDRAKRIREESEFIIEQQVKQAEEDLRREVAAAAVALAEQIVRRQLGAGDQQRLIDTFVHDVSGNGARPMAPHTPSGGTSGHGASRSEI